MYGDEAERKTPRQIRRLLVDFGGKTPTGIPCWRLVKAGDCRVAVQGTINHMPTGVDLDITVAPERIQGGRFLLPRYPDIGPEEWILQRWFPPSTWGSAEQWMSVRAHERPGQEDLPLFTQEFPFAGDYFMLAGPWRSVEEAGDLRIAIRLWLQQRLERPKDSEAYIQTLAAREVQQREKRIDRLTMEIDQAGQNTDPLWRAISGAAQKFRNLAAAEAGLETHLGAGEGWL